MAKIKKKKKKYVPKFYKRQIEILKAHPSVVDVEYLPEPKVERPDRIYWIADGPYLKVVIKYPRAVVVEPAQYYESGYRVYQRHKEPGNLTLLIPLGDPVSNTAYPPTAQNSHLIPLAHGSDKEKQGPYQGGGWVFGGHGDIRQLTGVSFDGEPTGYIQSCSGDLKVAVARLKNYPKGKRDVGPLVMSTIATLEKGTLGHCVFLDRGPFSMVKNHLTAKDAYKTQREINTGKTQV